MSMPSFSRPVSDFLLQYPFDPQTGRVGLQLIPAALEDSVAVRRGGLAGLPYIDAMPGAGNPPAWVVDPLVQIKILGDPYPGAFSQGHTMRNSPTLDRFRFDRQESEQSADQTIVRTFLKSSEGFLLKHELSWFRGDRAVQVQTSFINQSDQPVTLEMLSSFSLGGITPFHEADAPGRLQVHRFRSVWSAEGRLETRSLEDLHLERSWSGAGMFSERFGQVGSMPVRRWFPFVAVEDTEAGVTWAAQVAWAGSWQMEIFRQHDDVSLSGGWADREFGHWKKTVQPGETLEAPPAFLTCVQGGLMEACDRLTALQHRAAETHPKVEQDLPVVFNEWCTTWGDPQHDKVVAIADRLAGSGVRYLVIDAGWYKSGSADWSSGHGDWVPSPKLFPEGLAATAEAIRKRGLIPGLWFEMETVGSQSTAFSMIDHLLKRDGLPVTVRERRFWDLNDPWAVDYLTKKVIEVLRQGNFGYLKVDYNETIGLGSDDPDGLGEGLRKQIEGVYRFFEKIRSELPDLVIENCSSGGHRLEPSMLGRTAMSSFSDAHELVEIPIIAANLHALMLPRQSQIWAVLHASDSDRRLMYSLTATFLGRMALSGGVAELCSGQWETVLSAVEKYPWAASVIKHGTSRKFGCLGKSWRHPKGWQGIRRVSDCGRKILVVLHSFAEAPAQISIPLPEGTWRVTSHLSSGEHRLAIQGAELSGGIDADFSGSIWFLEREE